MAAPRRQWRKGINLCTGTENPSVSVSVGVLCCRDAPSGTKPGSIPDTPLF